MALMSKLKEMIPWKRKSVDTHEVMSLRNDINHLFDRFRMSPFETAWSRLAGVGSGIDMDETEEGIILRADVPGLDPKHLTVTIRNGMLHMSYEDEREWNERNGGGGGRRYAAFHRSVALPDGLDISKAKAACKHGCWVFEYPGRLKPGINLVRLKYPLSSTKHERRSMYLAYLWSGRFPCRSHVESA